jgi:hypothetical protein
MILLLKAYKAGRIRPKSRQERWEWDQRARELEAAGVL